MITAASLREYTRKDLAQMAKKQGVAGWHAMRKDQLVRALARAARSKRRASSSARKSSKPKTKSTRATVKSKPKAKAKTPAPRRRASVKSNGSRKKKSGVKTKNVRAVRRIQVANAEKERLKDLSSACQNGHAANGSGKRKKHLSKSNGSPRKDRIVLLVRDPYWLHACWEINRHSVERVRAALSEQWHTARPVLRLIEVEAGSTTSTAERVLREIDIHGGVNNWYVNCSDPPKSYRVDIGYLAATGRFCSLARSNSVTTPSPGSSDSLDQNWMDVARDYERVFSLSGGYSEKPTGGDLRDLFEERLRRPMGSPLVTKYGAAAGGPIGRKSDFALDADAELIVYGQTNPKAHVTLAGQPVKLRPDGSFTVRKSLPDRRQVLPVVAGSGDGLEQRTIILAIERNTKVMEPVKREPAEQAVQQ